MEKDKVPLVRRDTGGGACYVDTGNRLYSFINKFEPNSKTSKYPIIIGALQKMGFDAQMKGRNDIVIDDKKISGSAFTLSNNIFKHHGTILHSVNKDNLVKYLNPNKLKLQSKGIKSANARITNLIDIAPKISMDQIDNALIDSFNIHNDSMADIVMIDDSWTNSAVF
jgi:lipoate-protein ligase A